MFRENPTWWRIHCLIINAVDFLVDKMKTEQRKDPHMSKVIDYLLIKKEHRPSVHHLDPWYTNNLDHLKLYKGVLYHHKSINNEWLSHIIVPKSMVPEVLHRSHGDFQSGHPDWGSGLSDFCLAFNAH